MANRSGAPHPVQGCREVYSQSQRRNVTVARSPDFTLFRITGGSVGTYGALRRTPILISEGKKSTVVDREGALAQGSEQASFCFEANPGLRRLVILVWLGSKWMGA